MIKAKCTQDWGWLIKGRTYDVTDAGDELIFDGIIHFSKKAPFNEFCVFIIPGRVKK